jgi:hypothetical protein
MRPGKVIRTCCALLAVAALLTIFGCRNGVGVLLGAYTGPLPDRADIGGEVVILRRIYTSDQGGISALRVDRTRFLDQNRRNINRLVMVYPRDLLSAVEQLRLQVGDTLKISTRFESIVEASGESGAPDWPYEKYFDYPMGSHVLIKVEFVGRKPRASGAQEGVAQSSGRHDVKSRSVPPHWLQDMWNHTGAPA